MLIDTHTHLYFPGFVETDEASRALIERAQAAGVSPLITVGFDVTSSLKGLELAQKHESVFCALGVHPYDGAGWDLSVGTTFSQKIEEDRASGSTKIVAIGEIGLDYFHMKITKEEQQRVFREELQFAKKVNLPVIIHCREAFEDVFAILEEEKMLRVVFHCFSENLEAAQKIWEKGWHTSFTAVVSYPKSEELRRVVAACPPDRYFLETDAPFLPHQTLRGKKNESSFLPRLVETVAEVRHGSVGKIEEETTQNAIQFFGMKL
ncbi:MAG: TatD family hydrolase [Candidatus Gracilibacteria bacterium]